MTEIKYPNIDPPGETSEDRKHVRELLEKVSADILNPTMRMDELEYTKDVDVNQYRQIGNTKIEFSIVYEVEA